MLTYPKPPLNAFISGNDTICDNSSNNAEVKISFSGSCAYTFVYSHNGVNQNPITTSVNPYIISTIKEGLYELVSFSDVNEIGWTSGSAMVTLLESPEALFSLISDTLSILNSTALFTDNTVPGSSDLNS